MVSYKYQKFVPIELIENVNTWVNRNVAYERDRYPYSQRPNETLRLGTGDCEDYAYLKAHKLIQSGVDPKCLQIALVYDRLDNTVFHAVLLVPTRVKRGFLWNRRLKETVVVADNRTFSLYTFTETSYVLKSVHKIPQWCIDGE